MRNHPVPDCLFCQPDRPDLHRVIAANTTCYARYDNYPLAPGHIEIVPLRHVESLFDLTPAEVTDAWALLLAARAIVCAEHQPDGYTIGVNEGRVAGRTIDHAHIHLIPRHTGDVPDPRGGIRCVLPGPSPDAWTEPPDLLPADAETAEGRLDDDCVRPTGCFDKLKRCCPKGCAAAADELSQQTQDMEPEAPPRRPPYAVAYATEGGHQYEIALPGDASVRAVDGALIITHDSAVLALSSARPMEGT